MTRHYYTDPLAAAYMVKHFGMELEDGDGDLFINHSLESCDMMEDLLNYPSDKYYISPESEGILEPQKGDLLHIVRGFCSYYKTVDDIAKGKGKTVTGIWSAGEHWDIASKEPLHDWEIIQRQGKPFFWPEREE